MVAEGVALVTDALARGPRKAVERTIMVPGSPTGRAIRSEAAT